MFFFVYKTLKKFELFCFCSLIDYRFVYGAYLVGYALYTL